MRLLTSVFLLLVAASLCVAQQSKEFDDADYEQLLIKLLTPMQAKYRPNYLPGTELTIQEYKDGEPYGPQGSYVLKAPTAEYPASSPVRDPLPVKPEENDPAYTFRPRPAELRIDGHTVKCLLRAEPEHVISWMSYSSQGYTSLITKQWVLAADPKIVLREEKTFVEWDKWFWHTNPPAAWWAVTSIGVKKKVGDREYLCVELKHDFYFGADGYSITTDYVTADVPTYWIDRETVFYRVGKDRKKTFHFTRNRRMLDFKLPHTPL